MSDDELMARVRALRAAGQTPKQIARSLQVPRETVLTLLGADARRSGDPLEPGLVGCWVSPGWSRGLQVDGHDEWPDIEATDGVEGLVATLIAREDRGDKVAVTGFLVDVFCLGVKNALGPERMAWPAFVEFRHKYFSSYEQPPLAVPLRLSQDLVFGAVAYARGLGFEPHADFDAAAVHLGDWTGPSVIRFGQNGVPCYVQGPHDDPTSVIRTLEESVGRGNFEVLVGL